MGLANILKRKFRRKFEKEYYLLPKTEITYSHDLLYTYHNADFVKEPLFAESYKLCKEIGGNLLANYDIEWRIHVLCWAASLAKNVEGDFIDCGVHTGFCPRAVINYIDFNSLNKTYYLLDTFAGMDPKYSSELEMERHQKLGYGQKKDLYEQVKETFKEFNVKIIKGTVPDTLSLVNSEKVSFLHIDMNCVIPEIEALEYFWPKLSKGGVIVLDDYGYVGCLDQKLAHDKFAKSKGTQILSLPTCQGLIIKP